ncbi:hypothetical protein K9L05_02100 [Candidatus Babeliales bacterium]|nr:hypothetical protein [Candidatus Babeliales bacterium]MCF7899421.1 hypothetical protein [Candidatus Babeliales bacterium]
MMFLKDFQIKETVFKFFLLLTLILTVKILSKQEVKRINDSKIILKNLDKLNTEIDLLKFILSNIKECNNQLIQELVHKLNEIKRDAEEKNVESLVKADILGLQDTIEVYKKQILKV